MGWPPQPIKPARKVLFTNHANAARESGYVAPLHADLVAVTNQSLADIYQANSPRGLTIVHIPIATPQRSMHLPEPANDGLTVGVYLTGLTNEDRLQGVVEELANLPMIGKVFIRTHPVQIVNPDLSGIKLGQASVEISSTRPLWDDVERTDIAACGNSTVTIELLRAGKPVLYETRLDHFTEDHHSFAARGLVLVYPDNLNGEVIRQIGEHYSDQGWLEAMRYFDSSYQMDESVMLDRFRKSVADLLG